MLSRRYFKTTNVYVFLLHPLFSLILIIFYAFINVYRVYLLYVIYIGTSGNVYYAIEFYF